MERLTLFFRGNYVTDNWTRLKDKISIEYEIGYDYKLKQYTEIIYPYINFEQERSAGNDLLHVDDLTLSFEGAMLFKNLTFFL